MSKRDAHEMRVLRVNGTCPTPRDAWIAFYRLWRMAVRHDGPQENRRGATQLAFYALGGDRIERFVHLCMDRRDTMYLNHYLPPSVRKDKIDLDRKNRIYGKRNYDRRVRWMEQDKRIAAIIRNERGIEMTPLEVAEARREAINGIRKTAAERGIAVPADDEELLVWIKQGMTP